MYEYFIIVSALLFFVFSFVLALLLSKKNSQTDALISWSILFIGIVYGLVWLNILLALDSDLVFLGKDIIDQARSYWFVYSILPLLMVISVLVGWKLTRWPMRVMFRLGEFSFNFSVNELVGFGWLTLALSIFLRIIYVDAYGGLFGYFDHYQLIRSGISEAHNSWSFLQPFGMLGPFALLIFVVCISSERLERWGYFLAWTGLLISIPTSIYIFYSLVGRLDFIAFISVLALFFLMRKNIDGRFLLVSSLGAMFFLFFCLYVLSNTLGFKGADNQSDFIVKELSFPSASFFALIQKYNQTPRYFIDFIFSPLLLLPSSWNAGLFQTSSEINTLNLMGAVKGSQGVTGGVPVDLMTLGFMQLGLLGVILTSMLFGFLLKSIKFFLDGIIIKDLRLILLAFVIVRVAMLAIAYAQPDHLIEQLFPFIVIFVLGLCFNIYRKLRF